MGGGRLVTEGGLGDRASLRGGRRRYLDAAPEVDAVAHWPGAWRALLTRWLRGSAEVRRIPSLLRGLDGPQLAGAHALIEALVLGGWIVLDERHQRGGVWQPHQLRFRETDRLREALGLPRQDQRSAAQDQIASRRFDQPAAARLHAALLELPVSLWSRRIDLIEGVARWESESRRGTRRDFELLARGATKSLTVAEWDWIQQTLDLDALQLGGHSPGLWLRAGFGLTGPRGVLDLGACAEPLALTPDALHLASAIAPAPIRWQIIENRTSFERQARGSAPEVAVLWVPGRPPGWWRAATARLLDLAPAPAEIACDPDPAGIAIAAEIAKLLEARGLPWSLLGMSAADLDRLPTRLPLSEWDRRLLASLESPSLPAPLEDLRQALIERGEKGEQEGLL